MARPKGKEKIDLSFFEEVPPDTGRGQVPVVRINPSETLSFNKAFRTLFQWESYTVRLHRSGQMLLLEQAPAGKKAYRVPRPRGSVQAKGLADKLKQKGIPRPACYSMEWRGDMGLWAGQLDNTRCAPGAPKRPGGLPDLEALV